MSKIRGIPGKLTCFPTFLLVVTFHLNGKGCFQTRCSASRADKARDKPGRGNLPQSPLGHLTLNHSKQDNSYPSWWL